MSEPAAIRATFSDFKLIKGRRCAQLVFEVPIEEADAAVRTIGGMPQPATERWCGIALLDFSKPAQEPAKAKKAWKDFPPSQQAAIRCNDYDFRRFICKYHSPLMSANDPEDAANSVREWCGVKSRADLDTNLKAALTWKRLDDAFWLHMHGYDNG